MGCIQPIVIYALQTVAWRLRPDLQQSFFARLQGLEADANKGAGKGREAEGERREASLERGGEVMEGKERGGAGAGLVQDTRGFYGAVRFDLEGRDPTLGDVAKRGLLLLTADNEVVKVSGCCVGEGSRCTYATRNAAPHSPPPPSPPPLPPLLIFSLVPQARDRVSCQEAEQEAANLPWYT